jgi:hypothetical protein
MAHIRGVGGSTPLTATKFPVNKFTDPLALQLKMPAFMSRYFPDSLED